MKTVALSAAVAVVAAWVVTTLCAPPVPYHGPAIDVEDRLSSLEGRLARLQRDEPAQPMLEVQAPPPATKELLERLAKLEARVLERDDEPARREAAGDKSDGQRSAKPRKRQRERREWLDTPQTQYKLAMDYRRAGRHEKEEEWLRKVIEQAGPDAEIAQEAAYQIGWARDSRADYAGAREA